MKPSVAGLVAALAAAPALTPNALAQACPPDSVRVGPFCVDTYEASVWDLTQVLAAQQAIAIRRIRQGTATGPGLRGVGAVQLGVGVDDYTCNDNGDDCTDIYAASVPGVKPSAYITWFQAQQAAANSGKRLLSNAEWQMAAAGTPDPALSAPFSLDCNTNEGGGVGVDAVVDTGLRTNCVSRWGNLDMVGNVWEWVADWVPLSNACAINPLFPGSFNCFVGADPTGGPGALLRGGDYSNVLGGGSSAGVFAVTGQVMPNVSRDDIGFRAVR